MTSPPPTPPSGGGSSYGGRPKPPPGGGAASPPPETSEAKGAPSRTSGAAGVSQPTAPRDPADIARESRGAAEDFLKAANEPTQSDGAGPEERGRREQGRSAALQAYFVANAGRSLLPSGETTGTLSPNLKSEAG